MKHLIRFALTVIALLGFLTAVSAGSLDENRILVRILSKVQLDALNEKMKSTSCQCPGSRLTAQLLMKGAGEGRLLKENLVDADRFEHFVLILGGGDNGLTDALSFAMYLLEKFNSLSIDISAKLPLKVTAFFTNSSNLEENYSKIIQIINYMVADFDSQTLSAKVIERVTNGKKTLVLDGQIGSGLTGSLRDDAETGVVLVETLRKMDATILGHDGRSGYGCTVEKFVDKTTKINSAHIVINTFRVQNGQSSDGLVITKESNEAMLALLGQPAFNVPEPQKSANGIIVAYAELPEGFDCTPIDKPFENVQSLYNAWVAITVTTYDPAYVS